MDKESEAKDRAKELIKTMKVPGMWRAYTYPMNIEKPIPIDWRPLLTLAEDDKENPLTIEILEREDGKFYSNLFRCMMMKPFDSPQEAIEAHIEGMKAAGESIVKQSEKYKAMFC